MKFWIARDKVGCIGLYRQSPIWKWNKFGTFEDWHGGFLALLPSEDFPEVTFENSPQEVELKIVK